ncbi:DUF4810 domain-containing protein [Deefgea sp. CFH1-16]|nr:DUF4810 domain-containing protein [Deefgea sp. CFH1-16]
MKTMVFKRVTCWCSVLILGFLMGCAAPQKPLYSWGSYQKEIYAYFKNTQSSPTEQIIALEQQEQKAKAQGLAVPPGFHAHLGMLYANSGQIDKVQQQFEIEKQLYPESTTYMDFLLLNLNKK